MTRPIADRPAPELRPGPSGTVDQHFTALVDRWRGPLIGLLTAWRVTHPHEMAQDVFAELWLGRERYRGSWSDAGRAGGGLRGIAWNLVRAERRRQDRAPSGMPEEPLGGTTPGPDQEAERSEEDAAIRAAIETLPDDQRAIVYMRLLEGTAGRDVAALLGITERAVEGRLRRARIALAEVLLVRRGSRPEATATRGSGGGIE